MGTQLTLDLALRPALGRDDFLVATSNSAAVALVDQWPHWPAHAALILGAAGSGKSHLAHVWQGRTGAHIAPLSALTIETVPAFLATGAVVLEDATPENIPETALFHLLNLAKANDGHVLLTATMAPEGWGITLPDLRSRLVAIPTVTIAQPDDALLRGVLVKLFADRQIAIDESLVNFLLMRMPRSLGFAREIVARIDEAALEQGAEVTRPFVRRVLQDHLEPGLLDDDVNKLS